MASTSSPSGSTSASAATTSSGTSTSVFLVTSPDNGTSRKIAESILTKKLAACVNLVPKITSMYWWDGKVQEDTEELLIIKSSDSLTKQLEEEVKALHPYDTPEFIRLPITAGSQEYLDWIRQSTNQN
ncbi:CutA1-domain-containing protein [Cystobasidium minutum MCA 4210]|uniref:CutA1-domain-containing protein n=1 Tax=Cystobasidium minutum MCA 4210 TaxID=1397322 RepID=UPI0034CE6AD0|eukprot:jgi/Rhomi1/169795/fgenesh1_kg.3_\